MVGGFFRGGCRVIDCLQYLCVGTKSSVRCELTASLISAWDTGAWQGRVVVIADSHSRPFVVEAVRQLRESGRPFDVEIVTAVRDVSSRSDAYRFKPWMDWHSPYKTTLYVDTDTIFTGVGGLVSDIFDHMDRGLVFTQFSRWVSTGPRISGRIGKWRDAQPELLARATSQPFPAINTGVITYRADHPFFARWREVVVTGPSFLADELAAQILLPEWIDDVCVVGDEWNWSPVHGSAEFNMVRIAHGHGGKFFTRPRGREIFMPWLQRAINQVPVVRQHIIGDIQDNLDLWESHV